MNKLWFLTSPIFWTNSSEDKPTDQYLIKLKFIEGNNESFVPDNDNFGKGELISKNGNITYFKWNSRYYLVSSKIEMNNNVFKYFLEQDIWANLVLPFFKQQTKISLSRTSDSNEEETALLEDSRINELPLIYDEWKWIQKSGEKIISPLKHTYIAVNEKQYNYYQNSILTINDSISTNIYYVFDNTVFNFDKSISESKIKINDQPYVFIPLINDADFKYPSGSIIKLTNNISYLDSLALKPNFIGVFKGPNFLEKEIQQNSNSKTFMPMQFFLGSEDVAKGFKTLFMNGGDNLFAKIDVPIVSKYQKLIYENSIIEQNIFNINGGKNSYEIIFNGAGFIGYKDSKEINSNVFNNNFIETIINYGSFLPSLTNAYSSYINANKSQINAGIAKADVGLGIGMMGSIAAASVLAVTTGGASLVVPTIGGVLGIASSIMGNVGTKRSFSSKLEDMKRNDSNKNQSTDIIDNIMVRVLNKSYNSTTPLIILSSYFVQSLSIESQNLINDIYDKFGFVTIKFSSYSKLVTYAINNKWCYFEVNLKLFDFYIQNSPNLNQLEKSLINLVFSYGIRLRDK
ncbi:MAG: hypothetical protein KFW07_03160 [Mycoplasmataceae bacterium]|nr:hypothetical protein [Mycoplasmataceae bacterium]